MCKIGQSLGDIPVLHRACRDDSCQAVRDFIGHERWSVKGLAGVEPVRGGAPSGLGTRVAARQHDEDACIDDDSHER